MATKDCEKCKGEGQFEKEYREKGFPYTRYTRPVDCKPCGGWGTLTDKNTRPGEDWITSTEAMRRDGVVFDEDLAPDAYKRK